MGHGPLIFIFKLVKKVRPTTSIRSSTTGKLSSLLSLSTTESSRTVSTTSETPTGKKSTRDIRYLTMMKIEKPIFQEKKTLVCFYKLFKIEGKISILGVFVQTKIQIHVEKTMKNQEPLSIKNIKTLGIFIQLL